MSTLIHIADRVLNRPLLVTRDKAQVILSVLSGRIGVNDLTPEASRFEGSPFAPDENGRVRYRPYNIARGIAVVTITGSLVNRGAWVGASSGLTSYEGIQHQLKTALNDDQVTAVILDLHTPGGEAIGAFETAELVRKLAAKKHTVAVVNGLAASAGYAIASGASEIVTTETGVSGSIGVVMLHADFSKKLANEGIDPTLIFAGAHKVDGNPFEPLPDSVRDDLQAEVTAFYDLFVRTVAKGRGARFDAAAAKATEARTFIGKAAVDVGLADRVGTFESVLTELSRASGRSTPSSMKGKTMTDKTGAPAAETDAGITQEEHDQAVAAAEQKGFKAATERLTGILSADGIKGDAARMTAAVDLATKAPTMSAEDVTGFVKANVAEKPASDADVDKVLAKMDAAAEGITSSVSEAGDLTDKKPAANTPEGWKAEWEASPQLQGEYPKVEAYVAYQKREQRTKKAA